ncbi:MAG TPA: phosphodiester glycosidase family protein [Pyrinomonadaceae bacterium]|nr:phosphodiester glycosidase family protein [Pyrinomonadaceae bacterium]
MKELSVFICVQLWLIVSCLSISAQDFQKIRGGIEHAKITKQMKSADGKDEPVVFNLLRLDLREVRLDVVHAMDSAIGLEKTSSIAARHGAIGAINAGFFRLDKSVFAGDAAGVLMIDRKLLSESVNNRIALFISNKPKQTEVNFAHLNINDSLQIKKKDFQFSGINRQRKENELIEFTPRFHPTTLTDDNGLEIIVRNGKVVEINDRKGNSSIPQNGFVVSASGKMREQILPFVKIGRKIKLNTGTRFEIKDGFPNAESNKTTIRFSTVEDITNGVPQLIRNGKIEITWEQEKTGKAFVETHHPRTAVAKLKDGKFLMVTVDGRSKESGGISLLDLAAFLLGLGATDAMNLDGGGSTTMFLDGKVVNRPSDKEGERAVGDAILVFPRK